MEILVLHSIYQQQFRADLKELFKREFNLKEEKEICDDISAPACGYFGYRGRVKSIRILRKKINNLIENNYSFNKDDRMIVYFVDDKNKNTAKLRMKRIV